MKALSWPGSACGGLASWKKPGFDQGEDEKEEVGDRVDGEDQPEPLAPGQIGAGNVGQAAEDRDEPYEGVGQSRPRSALVPKIGFLDFAVHIPPKRKDRLEEGGLVFQL